jgi:hypothetical protein
MVSLSEERMKILKMLEEGKITAEEAITLLRALEGGAQTPPRAAPGGERRFLRINVSDLTSGKAKVNVTIPIGLVGVGLRIAERFAPGFEGIELQELEELLAGGVMGKVVEVVDEEENERVEISVE